MAQLISPIVHSHRQSDDPTAKYPWLRDLIAGLTAKFNYAAVRMIQSGKVAIDGMGPFLIQTQLADVDIDNDTFDRLIAQWQRASDRYRHWKSIFRSHRLCAHKIVRKM
jgi:hypothetical protein